MKSHHLITTSLTALIVAAASIVCEPAHAGFGGGRGGGMAPVGGGMSHGGGGFARSGGFSGGGFARSGGNFAHANGFSHAGGMSRANNVGGGAGGFGKASHASNVSGAHGLAAKGGDSATRHANNAHKPTKVADRDVGNHMKERAGTATHDSKGRPIGGSDYDTNTGRTTSSFKNGNGTHDVTVTDKDGKTISTGTSGKEPVGGSTTYGGTHTSSLTNGPGSHTITTTDGKGNTTTTTTGREPVGGTSVRGDGTTVTSVHNPDGSHTVTTTDGKGNTTTNVTGKEPSGGTSVRGDGTSVTSVHNPDGSHTVTTTDGKGNTTTNVTGKEPIGGSSSHSDGTTTTSVRNGDGSHTVTTSNGDRDVGGHMKERAGTGRADDGRRDGGGRGERGDRGGRGEGERGGDIVAVPVLPFDPNSGWSVFEGETTIVTGIGTDDKTVTRIDKDGNVKIATTPPAAPLVPADNLGDALKRLQDAAKRYAAAKAESRSAHISLDSIVGTDNPSADVKANIPDAIDRAADADRNLKSATQDLQRAMNDVQQQIAQQAARG